MKGEEAIRKLRRANWGCSVWKETACDEIACLNSLLEFHRVIDVCEGRVLIQAFRIMFVLFTSFTSMIYSLSTPVPLPYRLHQ